MSREQASQNDFALVKFILPWVKMMMSWVKLILPWVKLILPYCEIDCAVVKLILPWRNWFCRGEIDFAVAKLILPWVKRCCRDSCVSLQLPKCLHYFPAAIMVYQGGTPTRRFDTGLWKFLRHISTDTWSLGKRTGLKLGEVSQLFIFYNITLS